MMTIMFSGGAAWFGLALGVALFVEAGVFFALDRRRDSTRLRVRNRGIPMLLCMGVMFATSNAARLRGWTGTGMTVVFGVGMACAAATVAFAIRSLAARDAAHRRAVPPTPLE